MTIPNLITIARLLAVPLIVWLIVAHHPLAAFWGFVLAGVSDGVDGFLARQLNLRSDLGGYLDPLADKALLVSIYVSMSVLNEIPILITILVVSRDLFIIAGVVLSWMMGRPVAMRPLLISKLNTVAQIALAALVLADLAFPLDLATVRSVLIFVVGILTVMSGAIYLVDWVRHMGNSQLLTAVTRDSKGEPQP